jgi:hypothetical protein
MSPILRADNASPKDMARFYMAVVQAILLSGSESWVISKGTLRRLETFHAVSVHAIWLIGTYANFQMERGNILPLPRFLTFVVFHRSPLILPRARLHVLFPTLVSIHRSIGSAWLGSVPSGSYTDSPMLGVLNVLGLRLTRSPGFHGTHTLKLSATEAKNIHQGDAAED